MPTTEHKYHVEGMTCQGCVKSVTRILNEVPGIEEAKVSLEDKSAVVQTNGEFSEEKLREAFSDTDYEISEDGAKEKEKEREKEGLRRTDLVPNPSKFL